ncbi:MAG: hypothetical protein CBD18_08565 [Opitutales bacterium TMED158]|nr:MAG: hypothetical protein CBD18_08565 [Opitutales bacterium TMED158]
MNKSALFIALIIQGAFLAVTVFIIVLDTPESEPPRFEGKASMAVEKDDFREKQQRDRFLKRMKRLDPMQRLSVESALPSDLPPLPDLPVESFELQGDAAELMEDASAMLEQAGLFDSARRVAGETSAAAFFGVQDSGKRIAIVVNTSASVVRKARNKGVSIEEIHEEVVELIDGLDSGTLFGIVQFSQGARRFAPQMAPAIRRNKEEATRWTREELRGNPKVENERLLGHEAGLYFALEMVPDLIFLVTDGVLNKRVRSGSSYQYPEIPYEILIGAIDGQARKAGIRVRIHAIGFELKDKDRRGLERLTRRFGGTLREF